MSRRYIYRELRQAGMKAATAWVDAGRIDCFERLQAQGLVRIRAEQEQEDYFSVYGEPEGYTTIHGRRVNEDDARKEIERQLEDGCWCVITEYWDGKNWQHADSVGMCVGYNDVLSYTENWYVGDLMGAAVVACKQEARRSNI